MNLLVDVIPASWRRYVYGALSLLALVYAAWQASDGDWKAALTSLVGSAVTALAHANTTGTSEDAEP